MQQHGHSVASIYDLIHNHCEKSSEIYFCCELSCIAVCLFVCVENKINMTLSLDVTKVIPFLGDQTPPRSLHENASD